MPPKRKATGGGARGSKKAKTTEAATLKDAAAALKAEDKKHTGKKTHKVDDNCPLWNGKVRYQYNRHTMRSIAPIPCFKLPYENRPWDHTIICIKLCLGQNKILN